MAFVSKNPATEEVTAEYEEISDSELDARVACAESTYRSWREVPLDEKGVLMRRLAHVLRQNKDVLAKIITEEIGRPYAASVAEIEKCAWVCEFYADRAAEFLKDESIETDAGESYVSFEPLGVILAVMPWNFPFWQVVRFAAPAVMAGNTGVLKHASNVPRSAIAIEESFLEAGFPKGVFQNLLVGSKRVEKIIRDERIQAITLTGSEVAGAAVASSAAREIKKSVLELGGSDPFIVLENADIPLSCEVGVQARLQNMGQSCIAAKRFIVISSAHDAFVKEYKERYEALTIGDPFAPETNVGPMVSEASLVEVARQVEESVAQGAEVVVGGHRVERKGYFYAPTILTGVKKGMPVYDEEVFGPVAAVIRVEDDDEAVRVANDTRFGLGASIWTSDIERAKKMARKIESGSVFINGMVKSDPRLPFGGIKKSGYGRELSHYGMKEFVNAKTVWIK